jgi:hypothetical protein
MSYSNNIITAPVSISDVQNVLGVSDNKLSVLCTHSNINKWSKFKPIRSDIQGSLSDFSASDGNWGLTIPTIEDINNLVSEYPNAKWEYNLPRGAGNQEYYRLRDFNGYNHAAVPPVRSGHKKGEVISINGYDLPSMKYEVETTPNGENNLQLSDFNSNIWRAHLAIRLYYSATKNMGDSDVGTYVKTVYQDEDTIVNGYPYVWFDVPAVPDADFAICDDLAYYTQVVPYMYDKYTGLYPLPFDDDNYWLTTYKVEYQSKLSGIVYEISYDGITWMPKNAVNTKPTNWDGTVYLWLTLANKDGGNFTLYPYKGGGTFQVLVGTNDGGITSTKYVTPTIIDGLDKKNELSCVSVPNGAATSVYLKVPELFSTYGATANGRGGIGWLYLSWNSGKNFITQSEDTYI